MDSYEFTMNVELSEEERDTLQQMMGELQQDRSSEPMEPAALQQEVESLKKRMVYLTNICLTVDRSIKPLHEVIRLTLEKCEILNQRINTVIESLRSGEPL